MDMNNQSSVHLLVRIKSDKRFLNPLVLPTIFKNQLPEGCESITVVNAKGRRYPTCVTYTDNGKMELSYARWHAFVDENIIIGREINTLCFRTVSPTEFEVTCFGPDVIQTSVDYEGSVIYTKYLFKPTAITILKQFLPFQMLEDLNQSSSVKPIKTANIQGSNQHASQVNVIYKRYVDNEGYQRYRAVGFKGIQWTNFCIENNIDEDTTVLFTNLRNGNFRLDVFNENGVMIGSRNQIKHRCRVQSHKHTSSKPYFKIKFKSHTTRSRTITIPKSFVKQHRLYKYEGMALLLYGNMQFSVELIIKKDRRRPNDFNHLVVRTDWRMFFSKTDFSIGSRIRIEFHKELSKHAGVAVFEIC